MRTKTWIQWMLVTAALLVPAMLSLHAPEVAPAAAAEASSESEIAPTPGVCPVFCSTDAFCNTGCPIEAICRNHRCLQF